MFLSGKTDFRLLWNLSKRRNVELSFLATFFVSLLWWSIDWLTGLPVLADNGFRCCLLLWKSQWIFIGMFGVRNSLWPKTSRSVNIASSMSFFHINRKVSTSYMTYTYIILSKTSFYEAIQWVNVIIIMSSLSHYQRSPITTAHMKTCWMVQLKKNLNCFELKDLTFRGGISASDIVIFIPVNVAIHYRCFVSTIASTNSISLTRMLHCHRLK